MSRVLNNGAILPIQTELGITPINRTPTGALNRVPFCRGPQIFSTESLELEALYSP